MVRATAQILSRDGVEHLTTNRIAERAGVSIGSLHEYFPNKEALVNLADETSIASSSLDAPR